MASAAETIAIMIVLLLAGGSLATWIVAFERMRARQSILEFTPRRPVPWSGTEVAVVVTWFLILISASLAVPSRHDEPLTVDRFVVELGVNAILDVAITVVLLCFLHFVRRAARQDIGFESSPPKYDLLLVGAAGFLAAVGPVYAIQIVLIQYIKEDVHPILELLSETAGPLEIAAAVLTAVVIAPLFEEFIFRMFIQGWLEKAFVTAVPVEQPGELAMAPTLEFAAETEPAQENPYVSPALLPVDSPEQPELEVLDSTRQAVLPIVLSSLLFAAAHAHTWPSPIPLFPLALILGYIYWRTHRLLPCIIMHALFNGLSVLAVALSQVAPK